MSERTTSVPSISSPTDNNLRDVARQIKSILDVREGVIGDPLDRNVTIRELVSAGMATLSGDTLIGATAASNSTTTSSGGLGTTTAVTGTPEYYNGTIDTTTPPAAENFKAIGLFASVLLEWDLPRIKNYAYAEIWRSETDQIGNAILLGSSRGMSYSDYLGTSTTKYYWIRFVTQANITGPFNSTSGTPGSTAKSPGLLIESLSGQITETELHKDLGSRIDLVDKAGGLTTQVSTLNGRYTVKIDDKGYVTGYGLASTANNGVPTSEFLVRADRFAIGTPTVPGGGPAKYPFVVQTTPTTIRGVTVPAGVYMDTAFIKTASINAAQIGSIDADTINAGFVSSVDLQGATMYGSELYIGGTAVYEYNYPGQTNRRTGIAYVSNPNIAITQHGAEFDVDFFKIKNGSVLTTPFEVSGGVVRITNASIGTGTITSANIADTIQSTTYVAGKSGWQINKAGSMELNSAIFRGALDIRSNTTGGSLRITNNVIMVFDSSGKCRVKIGDLAAPETP